MNRHARKLRDQAARPTIRRIRADKRQAPEEVKPLLAVIAAHLFDHGFDVNRLRRECGAKKWVTERFTEHLGLGPGAYISKCRLDVGEALLGGTDLMVFQVADMLGYSASHDTFSKAFRRKYGKTPSRYRAEARANGVPALSESDPAVTKLIDVIDHATSVGDVVGARRGLAHADSLLRDQTVADLAVRLGLSLHERGDLRTRAGDVDRAYEDLHLARGCYTAAGELPTAIVRQQRSLPVSHDTDEALLSALCPDCRQRLSAEEGRSMRQNLKQALLLVPRDDPWFEASCDDCYRVAWTAISRARLGLMPDAWKAWWLSSNVDPKDRGCRPSRGRFIAAMAEVERLYSGDQLERKEYADLAVADAVALGDPLLEAEARLWLGAVLGAMTEFSDALEHVNAVRISGSPRWLSALLDRVMGLLEFYKSNYPGAIKLLESSAKLYDGLDPHICGLLVIQKANAYFELENYERSIDLNQQAVEFLDGRRDPLLVSGAIPIHVASSYGLLGMWERAELSLSECSFDRNVYPRYTATEEFTKACLALLNGRLQVSLNLFSEAQDLFAKLNIPRTAALAASYSIEAYARLGQTSRAIEAAVAALSFFQAAGCTKDALDTVGKLRALLEVEIIDLTAIEASVRRLTRQHGGWLPVPDSDSGWQVSGR